MANLATDQEAAPCSVERQRVNGSDVSFPGQLLLYRSATWETAEADAVSFANGGKKQLMYTLGETSNSRQVQVNIEVSTPVGATGPGTGGQDLEHGGEKDAGGCRRDWARRRLQPSLGARCLCNRIRK